MRVNYVKSFRSIPLPLAVIILVAITPPAPGQPPISDDGDETDTNRWETTRWPLLGSELMERRVPERADQATKDSMNEGRRHGDSASHKSLAQEGAGNALVPFVRDFRTWGATLLLLTYALVMIIMLHREAAGKQNRA